MPAETADHSTVTADPGHSPKVTPAVHGDMTWELAMTVPDAKTTHVFPGGSGPEDLPTETVPVF